MTATARIICLGALTLALVVPRVARAADPDAVLPIEKGDDPQDTYERNALGVLITHVTSQSGSTWSHRWDPFQGKFRKNISYEQFLVTAGRQDVWDHFAKQILPGRIVIFSGVGMVVGAVIWGVSSGVKNGPPKGPIVLASAGIVTVAVGLLVFDHFPCSDEEAVNIADRYNDQLRAKLGLPALPPEGVPAAWLSRPRPRSRLWSWALAPLIGADGQLGLAGSATF